MRTCLKLLDCSPKTRSRLGSGSWLGNKYSSSARTTSSTMAEVISGSSYPDTRFNITGTRSNYSSCWQLLKTTDPFEFVWKRSCSLNTNPGNPLKARMSDATLISALKKTEIVVCSDDRSVWSLTILFCSHTRRMKSLPCMIGNWLCQIFDRYGDVFYHGLL